MDVLETAYEDSNAVPDFIDCAVCSKSIRGETLYKIHLTTIQHIMKEDALVSLGRATRDHEVPHFTDIKQYLQYLDLDEPIIGLSALDEVEPVVHDNQPGPRYICRMCDLQASLPNMVNHIIGRKHRQKYLEANRPDLITWVSSNSLFQSGKTIRAKAEVLERQDGQGSPKPLRKNRNVGKLNISRVPVKQKGSQNQPKGGPTQGPPLSHSSYKRREARRPPEGLDFPGVEYKHRGDHPEDDLYRPPFHKSNPYFLDDTKREAYLREEDRHRNGFEDDRLDRAGFHEDDHHRRAFMEDEFCRRGRYLEENEHSQDYLEDTRRREILEESGSRPSHPEEIPRQTYPEDTYLEGPSRTRSYPDNDPLAQFYSEEVLRRTSHSVEASKERVFREDKPPHDRGYPRGPSFTEEFPLKQAYTDKTTLYFEHAHGRADHRQSFPERSYPKDTRRSDDEEEEARRRAYPEEELRRPAYPEGNPNRSLDRDPNGHGYPKGLDRQPADVQDRRFTDQMEEPIETGGQRDRDYLFDCVKTFHREGRGLKHPEAERGMAPPSMRGPPQRAAERVKTEIPEPFRRFLKGAIDDNKGPMKRKRKSRFSDATEQEWDVVVKKMQVDDCRRSEPIAKPQGGYHSAASLRPMVETTPDTGNVLDALNNIKVENVEEANFLKEKLCNLLKEFQAQKSQKTALAPGYKSPGPAVISKDYNHISKDQLESSRDNERTYREVPDERHYEGHPPRHSRECYTPEAPRDLYGRRPRDIDQRMERRAQYEEVFGQVNIYPESYDSPDEARAYPHERSQVLMPPRDFPPAEDLYDPFSSSTPAHRGQGYRMGAPHSTSLDKITSTLLELVARKR